MSIFFHGTLLHPQNLTRVIGNDGAHLEAAPAILPDFTQDLVNVSDCPAIIPYPSANTDRERSQDERSVKGTVVSGFTQDDIRLLDIFQGHEYTRRAVSVSLLGSFTLILDSLETHRAHEMALRGLPALIKVETYAWDKSLDRLVPEARSFDLWEKIWQQADQFCSSKLDYTMLDDKSASNRNIKSSNTLEVTEPPEFGHGLLSQFCLHKDYVNLNSGSFGSLPRPVFEAVEELSREVESRPDKFLRKKYFAQLITVRERLARLVGAETDEVVLVPNGTHGVNTILRNFIWKPEDVLVATTTTYGAISRTLQYIHDLPPHPALSIMNLTFPISHTAILEKFRAHLRTIPRKTGQNVVAVIDSIVSNPGCVMPWEKMVNICKEENVWSVVDAAHSIGQQVGIDLGEVKPDFWVSTCHKWLFAKRGNAVLYVGAV